MNLDIFSLIVGYTIAPSLYYRSFSNKIIKKAPTKGNVIALTFDDGPNPEYTPKLLDVLKKNDIKCTFFVLAENAQKYPDIIKRIESEGHYIGLHSLKHMNAIFSSPYQTRKNFSEALNIMDHLGIKIKFFRPPWGIFNPLTYYYANANNLKIILWSIHAMDWSRWVTEDYIKKKLINNIKSGDIILLHDGRGSKNSPTKTIRALQTVLPVLKRKGYRFILVKDL
ncbi:polysaccharide deacetylase family protein [Clostridium sp. WILCCON 0269]|uniref:Polysaccharide deacetylase family protein n=1 Tax=Candidatus Clostridium eludens TaxID=3381663 RepID=A0ABW8SI15_9CLOT